MSANAGHSWPEGETISTEDVYNGINTGYNLQIVDAPQGGRRITVGSVRHIDDLQRQLLDCDWLWPTVAQAIRVTSYLR